MVFVAAANDRLWQALCKVIGLDYLAEDPGFRTNPDRVRNRDQLMPLLQRVFAQKPRDIG